MPQKGDKQPPRRVEILRPTWPSEKDEDEEGDEEGYLGDDEGDEPAPPQLPPAEEGDEEGYLGDDEGDDK